ncbi:helix-turn-helix domain-containing protein [Thalassovita taeanensis]|uniref:Regulatory helix-turn-helix protein, lysR family n=1 Tax=Thalassovita taeanensis TaxID=657014 RepID=A0A1H9AZ35_9RHOB|nr:LysR family transcriptional regulator [Thalassovita taeanensis]SEP82040.1 regulatory helix-turn-helix protein, lysR family [Thalassovita taeanensis]
MSEQQNHALLFELLRSFTTLADTLNLSRAVEKLSSTRQTVRRHISILEQIKGEALFEVEDRQYHLTDAGRRSVREAEDILARGRAWINNEAGHIGGLYLINRGGDGDWYYHLQQHPISDIWTSKSRLLKQGIKCWAEAEGDIESPALEPIRPNLMVFRRLEGDWVCAKVGSESSYATWYGWRWELSAIGRKVPSLPGGAALAHLLAQPFEEVRANHGLRYDHVFTQMHRGEDGNMEPISFKRLLMGCRFPDGSFALASLVERSHDLRIEGVSDAQIRLMPENLVMDSIPAEEELGKDFSS